MNKQLENLSQEWHLHKAVKKAAPAAPIRDDDITYLDVMEEHGVSAEVAQQLLVDLWTSHIWERHYAMVDGRERMVYRKKTGLKGFLFSWGMVRFLAVVGGSSFILSVIGLSCPPMADAFAITGALTIPVGIAMIIGAAVMAAGLHSHFEPLDPYSCWA